MNEAETRLWNAVGFAMKAGKIAAGEFAAEKALKSGAAKLVIVDTDASENTKKQWRDACAFRKVPLIEMAEAGRAIGKSNRMTAACTDGNFSKMILHAYEGAVSAKEVGNEKGQNNGGDDQ